MKKNKVVEITNLGTSKLNGYVMFSDNWISEIDKKLIDEKGEIYTVLDFMETTKNSKDVGPYSPYVNPWREMKFSCVRLDKPVNVGDVLIVYN